MKLILKGIIFIIVLFPLTNCSPGQLFGPTLTPTSTNTPIPTNTPTITPTYTPTSTSTIDPSLGIDIPMALQGVEFKITSVKEQSSYTSGFAIKPKDTNDVFLIVYAKYLSGDFEIMRNWKVTVFDENDEIFYNTVTSSNPNYDYVEWVFTVHKSSKSFVLSLPENQRILLDNLLNK